MLKLKAKTLDEFKYSFKNFSKNYPLFTYLIIFLTLTLSIVELVSMSMLLPLASLGLEDSNTSGFLDFIKNIFLKFGISYSFNVIFITFVIVYLLKILIVLIIGIYIDNATYYISTDLREKVIKGLKTTSWSYFKSKKQGLITNLLTMEISNSSENFRNTVSIIESIFLFFIYILLGVSVSSGTLLGIFLLIIISITFLKPFFQMARKAGKKKVDDIRNMSTYINSGLKSLKIFKATNKEDFLIESLISSNIEFLRANKITVKSKRFLEAFQNTFQLIGFTIGLYFVRDVLELNLIEIGFLGYVYIKLYTHLAHILKKYQVLTNNISYLKRVNSFVDELKKNRDQVFGSVKPELPSEIQIKSLSFSYGKTLILKNISLTIPKKGLTIIFGKSGAGKTTIFDLITGLYDIEKKKIFLGNYDLRDIKISNFRSQIGYVTQDPFLINGTILDNIISFKKKYNKTELDNTIIKCGLENLIKKLPQGIMSNIGESGAFLSGGEKQRIAIARSLIDKPKLILMDEPTSSLDEEISKEIIVNVKRISKNIPIIMITHQKEYLKVADTAYEIQNMKVNKIK